MAEGVNDSEGTEDGDAIATKADVQEAAKLASTAAVSAYAGRQEEKEKDRAIIEEKKAAQAKFQATMNGVAAEFEGVSVGGVAWKVIKAEAIANMTKSGAMATVDSDEAFSEMLADEVRKQAKGSGLRPKGQLPSDADQRLADIGQGGGAGGGRDGADSDAAGSEKGDGGPKYGIHDESWGDLDMAELRDDLADEAEDYLKKHNKQRAAAAKEGGI